MTLELKLPAVTNRYCGDCKKSTPRIKKLRGELCGQCRKFFSLTKDTQSVYNVTIRQKAD